MILVSVGTFTNGFDALVAAADRAAGRLGIEGFAQIGHSAVIPRRLAFGRFLPHGELQARLRAARLVVCHGGAGIIGEAMRAGRAIIAVPRRGPTTAAHPANDQTAFVERLAALCPLRVCREPEDLAAHLEAALRELDRQPVYPLGTDVPGRIAGFLGARS